MQFLNAANRVEKIIVQYTDVDKLLPSSTLVVRF